MPSHTHPRAAFECLSGAGECSYTNSYRYFWICCAPRMVVIANRKNPYISISSHLKYDGRPSNRKFLREKLKYGLQKPIRRKSLWMGDIESGISHFLCPDHQIWLPNQRYDITLEEKRKAQKETADEWREGLSNGTYKNKADIANQNRCSRAWVTRLLDRDFSLAHP